jgi:hypothetical protein
MKLVDHFTSFMKDTVNLNATRLEQLETSVEALKDVVRESKWAAPLIAFEEQGSWAHKTMPDSSCGKLENMWRKVLLDRAVQS